MTLLHVEGLTKRFGGLTAVDGVTFTVHEGVIQAVIGPNGAGKTTLFNLLTGFDQPDEGTDHRALPHGCPALEHREGTQPCSRLDHDIRTHVGGRGIFDEYSGGGERHQPRFTVAPGLIGDRRLRGSIGCHRPDLHF